jgi:DNA-binding NarL/FixJ family response regulator
LQIEHGRLGKQNMKNLSSIPKSTCPHCGQLLEAAVSPDWLSAELDRSHPALSLREQQLVDLVIQAKSNKEIAYELSLTVGSVKEYMHRVFRKVGVRSRTELALWGVRAQTQPSTDLLV